MTNTYYLIEELEGISDHILDMLESTPPIRIVEQLARINVAIEIIIAELEAQP